MSDKIKSLFEQWATKNYIVAKTEGGVITSDADFGGILPRPLMLELLSTARDQSEIMRAVTTRTLNSQVGNFPIVDFSEPVTEGVGENDGTPVTTNAAYAVKKYKSEWHITTEQIQNAQDAGMGDFEAQMVKEFGTALGNDQANILMNSDTTLNSATRTNRMLRMVDGVLKRLHAGANVYNAAGKDWGQGIWSHMRTKMPEKFRNDPSLAWIYNSAVEILWRRSLTNISGTTAGMRSGLGDQVIQSALRVPPDGSPQIITPYISGEQGPTAIAPTSVSGTTTVIAVCTTLLATTAAARRIKITCVATGLSEVCTPVWTTVNTITTTTTLGQQTVSATASDYVITWADETSIILGNPKGINMIFWTTMRSYREFNKDFDRFEITTYWYGDVVVPLPETFVVHERVCAAPPVSW
jgi:hypothetical protein